MAEVHLVNVSKRFDTKNASAVLAVKDLSMDVADGEFLVLLGPSGCGKTTTLRMVAGLETATAGEIYIADRPVTHLPPGDRDIAFVFQFYALYPHLTVRDNISFPLRAQKVPAEEVQQRVGRVAKLLRIEHVLNRRPNRLPSGEQQRVALGRAIIRQPQVFLMDEPLTNLDASLRTEMRVELKHLQQEIGTTTLYVTHDQTEAMSMSHRIAVMNLGILQQIGTPLEVYNHPQTLFVAQFIGSPPMNIIPCRLVEGNQLHSIPDFLHITLDQNHKQKFDVGREWDVLLGVRSEDMRIVPSGEDADCIGVIAVREPLGDETVYRVETPGELLLVKTPPRQVYQPGERVGLKVDRNRIHLFDRTTEQSMLTWVTG